jgi:hypothetical protein
MQPDRAACLLETFMCIERPSFAHDFLSNKEKAFSVFSSRSLSRNQLEAIEASYFNKPRSTSLGDECRFAWKVARCKRSFNGQRTPTSDKRSETKVSIVNTLDNRSNAKKASVAAPKLMIRSSPFNCIQISARGIVSTAAREVSVEGVLTI